MVFSLSFFDGNAISPNFDNVPIPAEHTDFKTFLLESAVFRYDALLLGFRNRLELSVR